MIRGVGLRGAVAVNVAAMIGAGPLITIPLVVAAMHGTVSLAAWILGAVIALCDGLVYAELAGRLPRTGGTYAYLREAFGANGPGRLVAFVYVWQLFFSIPLLLASGYIGFAQYAGFLVPAVAHDPLLQKVVAVGVGALTLLLLYRPIPAIARTAIVLAAIALLTLAAVAAAGLTHPVQPFGPIVAHALDPIGLGALGAALVLTAYDYAGYGDVTQMGEEVIAPQRTIPLAVLWSVAAVATAYIVLNLGVFATLTPDAVAHASSVASQVVEHALGHGAAIVVTVGVLITAFASTYGALLGASRVPFAAARDGDFLAPFARLHPTGKFPVVSLVVLGLLALPACFFSLGDVINALTAAAVLAGSSAQIVGLAILRRRSPAAPFRIPLYPLPPLIALGAWIYLFIATGTTAMLFGAITLALGAIVFLVRARIARSWPFAAAALAALLTFALPPPASAEPAFGHAAIVQRDGSPTLVVDGKPFFFWGASFFYERLPADQWSPVMDALRAMHLNTLDLYLPWNWHEISDGRFDFEGTTDPRRNLRRVLRLARDHGFYVVLRPGPVIRNEWRNGGYPDWLLTRPEYGMPLHDVLEGRYPATATLQNANSDDAAAQWLANRTHIAYAHRWLTTVLRECRPIADRVIAVQLDDDQGAYLDNQTWPAPHLTSYLGWLEKTARTVIGPTVPVFINTYEMKVTASAPVWAMGNWYQSDAYSLGEHDRSILEFSTGLLQTQSRGPVAISEFQAGWLAQPEDPQPRPADPTNTTLALHTLLGMGARGVIDFPPIDTFNPAGWEAPFANASYAWDAALGWERWNDALELIHSARYEPTRDFGDLVAANGDDLATVRRIADGAVVYLTSAFDPSRITNADVFAIAARTQEALRACRARSLTCDLVDLAFTPERRLRDYRFLVVPPIAAAHALTSSALARLDRYRAAGGIVAGEPPASAKPVNGGIPDLTLLRSARGRVFADIVNYDDAPRMLPDAIFTLPGLPPLELRSRKLAARDAILEPLVTHDTRQATIVTARPSSQFHPCWDGEGEVIPAGDPRNHASAYGAVESGADEFGNRAITLKNALLTARILPDAGGRLMEFKIPPRGCENHSATTSVGALRDDALLQLPPSTTDRIGKYTRSFPAGMFNRHYTAITHVGAKLGEARADVRDVAPDEVGVDLLYDAPDVAPHGAHFHRRIRLKSGEPRLVVTDLSEFPNDDGRQRVVRYDSFDTRDAQTIDARTDGAFGIWNAKRHQLLIVAWPHDDVESADVLPERSSIVLELRLASAAGHPRTVVYALLPSESLDAAKAAVTAEARRAQAP